MFLSTEKLRTPETPQGVGLGMQRFDALWGQRISQGAWQSEAGVLGLQKLWWMTWPSWWFLIWNQSLRGLLLGIIFSFLSSVLKGSQANPRLLAFHCFLLVPFCCVVEWQFWSIWLRQVIVRSIIARESEKFTIIYRCMTQGNKLHLYSLACFFAAVASLIHSTILKSLGRNLFK